MKKYEEALRARFENTGIVFENGEYFERVAAITPVICDDNTGYDSDENAENNK